jgi:Flp pilus assembly protein TadD
LEEALSEYDRAIDTQPDLAEAHKAIADLYLQQQDSLRAIVAHRRVVELSPQDASSYYHLGLALKERGRTDEALTVLQQARELYQQQGQTEQIQQVEAALRELQGLD